MHHLRLMSVWVFVVNLRNAAAVAVAWHEASPVHSNVTKSEIYRLSLISSQYCYRAVLPAVAANIENNGRTHPNLISLRQ